MPFIFEDRIGEKDFIEALTKIYNMGPEERSALGTAGQKHVLKNYNFKDFLDSWDRLMTEVHEENGSWKTRKNYTTWTMDKII